MSLLRHQKDSHDGILCDQRPHRDKSLMELGSFSRALKYRKIRHDQRLLNWQLTARQRCATDRITRSSSSSASNATCGSATETASAKMPHASACQKARFAGLERNKMKDQDFDAFARNAIILDLISSDSFGELLLAFKYTSSSSAAFS